MAVWSDELHISSVTLKITAYGTYSEDFFRLSSTSDPGMVLNILSRQRKSVYLKPKLKTLNGREMGILMRHSEEFVSTASQNAKEIFT